VRLTNILFYILLGLTIFLLAIHVKRTVYFENPSKELTEKAYSGQVIISTHLTSYDNEYLFNCSFHHIKTEIVVKNLDVQLVQFDKTEQTTLNLDKVLPYSGMHPWDIPEFKRFTNISDSLKVLNSSNNPYFAYDFAFKRDAKNMGDKFIAKISVHFKENGSDKNLTKELLIVRKSEIEIKPLDAHSDGSFLLIPVTGLTTVVLLVIKIFVTIRRKQRAAKSTNSK
jgi:hypothetical protein